MFPVLRVLIGLMFIVSGGEKLIWPYQNFLYVIQGYQLLPASAAMAAARVFPWVEFLVGVFLALGLWVPLALRAAAGMFTLFILIISQALLRKIPLGECGCFGELVSIAP